MEAVRTFPTVHLTLSGFHAGRTLCGADRAEAEASGATFLHAQYYEGAADKPYMQSCCAECKRVYLDAVSDDDDDDEDEPSPAPKMIPADVRSRIVSALVACDRRQRHNPYALSHYLRALENTERDMAEGSTLAQALYDNFSDRVLTSVEKAAGLPTTLGGGGHDKGRPTY